MVDSSCCGDRGAAKIEPIEVQEGYRSLRGGCLTRLVILMNSRQQCASQKYRDTGILAASALTRGKIIKKEVPIQVAD